MSLSEWKGELSIYYFPKVYTWGDAVEGNFGISEWSKLEKKTYHAQSLKYAQHNSSRPKDLMKQGHYNNKF